VLLLARCPAVVTRHLPGRPLPGDDTTALRPWVPGLAGLLADLHGSVCALPRRRDTEALLRSVRRKAADMDRTPLAAAAHRVADRMGDLAPGLPASVEGLVPTHGDAAAHNVLRGPAGLQLVDWDRAALASPARDLAYLGAAAWARDLLGDRPASWSILTDVVEAYADRREPPDRATLEWYRAWALVRIAHGWSAFRRAPGLAGVVLDEAAGALHGVSLPRS
jgi:thiamine kinase-like enzyme